MIIGSDFDGVIADDILERISFVRENFGVELRPDEVHGSKLEAKLGKAAKERIEREVNCSERTLNFVPTPFVREVFKKFVREGDKIVIITGRTKQGVFWARKFLEINGIPFHHIWSSKEFFFSKERDFVRSESGRDVLLKGKGRLADSIRPRVFVEDSDAHLLHLSQVKDFVRLFLFDRPYNKHFSMEGVKRVKSWKEIYDEVELIKARDLVKEGLR
ncbi:hypothetical protein DRJ25_00790 [Candidatus Woesearchaeota archaeon]|nr:MAG: hypothetical protein DRJ25_00790 [Candidatus Woesearchaeota archaeon]